MKPDRGLDQQAFQTARFDHFLSENDQKQPKFNITYWQRMPD